MTTCDILDLTGDDDVSPTPAALRPGSTRPAADLSDDDSITDSKDGDIKNETAARSSPRLGASPVPSAAPVPTRDHSTRRSARPPSAVAIDPCAPVHPSSDWTPDEDAKLARLAWENRELVNAGDAAAWPIVGAQLGGATKRTARQVAARWHVLVKEVAAAVAAENVDNPPEHPDWAPHELEQMRATTVDLGGDHDADDGGWSEGAERVAMWALVRAAVGSGSKSMSEVVRTWRNRARVYDLTADLDLDQSAHAPAADPSTSRTSAASAPSTAHDVEANPVSPDSKPDAPNQAGEPWTVADDHGAATGTASSTWTSADDDSLLLLRLDGLAVPVCADRLGKTLDSVNQCLARLHATGQLQAALKIWTAVDDKLLADLLRTEPVDVIAQTLDRPTIAVMWRIGVVRASGLIPGASSSASATSAPGSAEPPTSTALASTLSEPAAAATAGLGQAATAAGPSAAASTASAVEVMPSASASQAAPATSPSQAASAAGAIFNLESPGARDERRRSDGGTEGAPSGLQQGRKKGYYTAEEDAVLVKRRASGLSFPAIADELRRSQSSVYQRFTILKGKGKTAAPPGDIKAPPTPSGASAINGPPATGRPPLSKPDVLRRHISSVVPDLRPPPSFVAPSATAPQHGQLPPPTEPDWALMDDVVVRLLQCGSDYPTIAAAVGTSSWNVAVRVDKMRAAWARVGLLAPSASQPLSIRRNDQSSGAGPRVGYGPQRSASSGPSALPEHGTNTTYPASRIFAPLSSSAAPPDTPSSSVGPSSSMLSRYDASRASHSAPLSPRLPSPTLAGRPLLVLPVRPAPLTSARPADRAAPPLGDASSQPLRKRPRLDDEPSLGAAPATSPGAALAAAPRTAAAAAAELAPAPKRMRKTWFGKSKVDPWHDLEKVTATMRRFSASLREDGWLSEAAQEEGKEEEE